MKQYIKDIIILVIFVVSLTCSFFAGKFAQWFSSNQCYSSVLNRIKADFSVSNSIQKDQDLEELLGKIETRGYETECDEIRYKIDL